MIGASLVIKATLLNAKAKGGCDSSIMPEHFHISRLSSPHDQVVGTAIDVKLGAEDIRRAYVQLVGQDKAQFSADLSPIASLGYPGSHYCAEVVNV